MTSDAPVPPDARPADAAPPDPTPPDLAGLAGLSYEQSRDELTDVVRRLEAGGVPLEESLALWERGEALARRCGQLLDGAQARLDAARAPERVAAPRTDD